MEEEINEHEIDRKKLELYLLYAQALDIHRSYYQEFGETILNHLIEKYFLVNKTWLDDYKAKYDYKLIIQDAENYQYDDYKTFKSKIMNRMKKNDNKKALKISHPKLEQEILSDYEIILPKNFVIVKKEIFDSYFLKSELYYDIIIGETNIFIFDKKSENSKNDNIFICSIQYDENSDDITNFTVNVDYILIFEKNFANEEKIEFFSSIKNGKGIDNYFIKKKLDNNHYGEQIIFRNHNQKVGFLFKIKNNDNYLKEKKNSEAFLNEYIKQVYPNNTTEIIINSISRGDIGIMNMPKQINSKCITIYGNLYYYLRDDNEDNNYSISEYSNINPNY